MAIAPQRLGIGIRRHFTTEGEHPYDGIDWEQRDARITDLRDGSVAFEQLGVEVPAAWSVNATNILSQKYFRGNLGSPERETSLREVIDRVADTITAWGERDGYFVDRAEAEAFRDELKLLVVTQRAAFNSPVWFNIGVKGVPQQASACFILSVEDKMDSILNWYVEEGVIFKGGSGSGVNLSSIRSSSEPLAGGGTASGPVSFMRGADASAGTIKCLRADTPIWTSTGVVAIRDVAIGAEVLTRWGHRRVLAVHDNGVRPLLRVKTELGDELCCTPEHRFWTRGVDGEGWREAQHLEPEDRVLLDTCPDDLGRLQPLQPVGPGHHNELTHDLPAELDEPFAMWLGWLFGDGSITERPLASFVAVQIGDKDPELASRYRDLTRHVFGGVRLFESRHSDRDDSSASVRFSSTQVIRFLHTNGLAKAKSADLRVPPLVFASPAPVRAAFLAGLFEADGHIGNGYPTLSTVGDGFALDVHRLLFSLGIPSTIGLITDRRAAIGERPVWTVRVIGGEGVRRFAKQVGFVSERKSLQLEHARAREDASPYETQWVLPHLTGELTELWQRGDAALRRALSAYCRTAVPRGLSLLRARALLERFPAELSGTTVERFAEGGELWVRVTVEPCGQAPTFDLTIDEVNEYLVHNLVSHNSGGKTRRAAKMVILDADHPDVEDFIWCKATEERKARVLRDAGFDMDLDGRDSHSIQYQNANNSVRVSDEFMQAVVDDADWHLRAVTTGETAKTVRARDLFRQIATAAWECADPGMQFDTTINRWHTAQATGRINASNPCFPGDARVHTSKGLVSFSDLLERVQRGETFAVYTHDATSSTGPARAVELSSPDAFMITGLNEIVRLRFDNGAVLRCTPGHRIFTVNRGFVEARSLAPEDEVKLLDLPSPAVDADLCLPDPTDAAGYRSKGDSLREQELPETWSSELAHYLGWLIGDGSMSGSTASTIYGSPDDREEVLWRHAELIGSINGGVLPKPSEQANGTVQLRIGRRAFKRMLERLGARSCRGPDKVVPWAVEQAPPWAIASFLQGLFDADGCVVKNRDEGSYVGLGSASVELLRGVQRLLLALGVNSSIDRTSRAKSEEMYDLRISPGSILRFADQVGFSLSRKRALLGEIAVCGQRGFYEERFTAHVVEQVPDGAELTYNLSEPRNHSYIVDGIVVRNCSEYMHLDNSACNLASLNLLEFLDGEGRFDTEGFGAAVDVLFTAQEILVGNADYPTERIAETSRRFRQLGIGYANLGAMLMAVGLPYDSDEGRAWAGAVTALMTGRAYATSARTAARMGPFAGYHDNAGSMLDVLRMHRDEVAGIDEELVPTELLSAAQEAWDSAVELGERFGVRNSQASVLAPTGTISLLMDCDTTGVEPDLGLVKTKKLVGGGTMSIVNQTVPRALECLGYGPEQVRDIVAHIDRARTVVGAPHLDPAHLPVFACSMGDNTIHHSGHVRMMAAVQPFISGAISKTVNLPEGATVEDVEQMHLDAWRMGLKAIAIYRDNCKVAQPLATTKVDERAGSEAEAHDQRLAVKVAKLEAALENQTTVVVKQPIRERLPRRRRSNTFAFRVADCEGYVTVGEYEDGRPGEVFMKVSKQGSTLAGIMDAFAIAVSLGLQHGVPLATFVRKYTNMRFEPAGITDDPDLRLAASLADYIFRRLAVDYLPAAERVELGIMTSAERTQPTLPGVEENVPDEGIVEPVIGAVPGGLEAKDAPYCYQCGNAMQRAGACYVCPSCGTTSGCS